MKNRIDYLVGTVCMTYNHSQFIEDTLHGFVIQKTTFPIIFIVIDDASSDNEQEVLRLWAKENLLLDEQFVALKKEMTCGELIYARHKDNNNSFYLFLLLKENHYRIGKSHLKYTYISEWTNKIKYNALCEGDDYWIDPLKLQKQVDYMEANPNCVMIHTGFEYKGKGDSIINEKDIIKQNLSIINSGDDLRPYILDGNKYLIQTVTVLCRKDVYDRAKLDIEKYKNKFLLGDTTLWISMLKYGSFVFFPEVTSVYRLHENSVSHQQDIEKKLRFLLSTEEMRVIVSQDNGLSAKYVVKFQKQYYKTLLQYLFFNKDYQTIVDDGFTTNFQKFILKLSRTTMFGNIGRILVKIKAKWEQ